MHQALLEAGFLDPDGKIHDWDEHNGYHVSYSERAKSAADARWAKKRERDEKKRNERKGKEPSIASGNASSMDGLECPQNLRTPEFLATWTEWVDYRKKRAGCKDWIRMFQKQLDWLGGFPEATARAMLDQSIRFNWQSIQEVKNGTHNNKFGALNGGSTADRRNAVISGADRIKAELEAKGDSDDLPFLPG
jgi:hypothetical protein